MGRVSDEDRTETVARHFPRSCRVCCCCPCASLSLLRVHPSSAPPPCPRRHDGRHCAVHAQRTGNRWNRRSGHGPHTGATGSTHTQATTTRGRRRTQGTQTGRTAQNNDTRTKAAHKLRARFHPPPRGRATSDGASEGRDQSSAPALDRVVPPFAASLSLLPSILTLRRIGRAQSDQRGLALAAGCHSHCTSRFDHTCPRRGRRA